MGPPVFLASRLKSSACRVPTSFCISVYSCSRPCICTFTLTNTLILTPTTYIHNAQGTSLCALNTRPRSPGFLQAPLAMFLSTLVLGIIVLVAWPPAPSVPSPNPALKHLQSFFTTWTATRVHPGLFLLPHRLSFSSSWGTDLTDLNFESETSNSSSSSSVTWLVHAYAPFDADAQRTNVLITRQLGPMLTKRQQHQQQQQCGASPVVRLGKLDITQNRQAAQELLDMDEDAGVGSVLTVLHLNVDGDGSGNEVQYDGPRTRQALENLLDNLQAGDDAVYAVVSPVYLQKHEEILSFLKEHPLAFVLGREEEGVVTEEEAKFVATCEAFGWQHCAVVHSKKALLRAAVASLWESMGDDHQGAVIAKLDQGRDALLYQPSSPSSSSSSTSVEEWMVQYGFALATHLDLAGSHFQRFILGHQQQQQQQQQLVVAVVRPFEDSVEEVKAVLDTLQDAARRHPETRFGYVTSAGEKGWPAFVARHFVSEEGRDEGTSASCRLFLLDCQSYALYEEPAGVEKLEVLLEEVQAGTRSPRVLTPRSVLQVEKRVLSEEEVEQRQLEATAAVAGGAAVPIDEDMPAMAPEAVRRLMVEGLAAVCVAALVVFFLMMTTAAGKKEETAAAAVSAVEIKKEEVVVEMKKEMNVDQQQEQQHSLPIIPAFVEEEESEKARHASRMMMISETLD